ncbi:zinc phosphodiesterase ELAC protein 2-like [Stegodyphus dumicola]|uniref:zinc phosphodiesterase ELAC protein 2-like n=1 Tax=Stegodyphus dumicola TaxID=202533 RepID=UPI0015B1E981|nr:zinc phosphodiesterase ELAC protein 2-like [Stegodyphus dumicola]
MKTFNGLEDLNIVQANTLDRYYLRPAKGFDSSLAVAVDPKMFIEEATNAEGFNESLKNLQSQIRENSVKTYNSDDKYPTVIFLGTGSSIPSKVRNVSAILVNISANKYLLMDCGEGTQGQIVRLFGDAYSNVLRDIFCIFVSHIHADHHLGLIQLLKCRAEAFKKFNREYEPLVLIGPSMLFYWLQNYHNMFEKVSSLYSFIKCSSLQHNEKILCGAEELVASKNFENITLATVLVDHCPDAYGLIMTHKTSKWKLVYSGDTMPCERLIAAGDGCSLLIHEATMEDELADEAVMKKHSTTSQAIQVGEMMKSKYTLLTHFSQRYAKVPVFSEKFHSYIGCAFDNMRVTPNELYILPLLIPALKCLFAEDIEEQQIKGHKRRKKLKLIQSVLAQE